MQLPELLGVHEASELLGLTRAALHNRRQLPDFPAPIQTVAATPLWTREQLVEYAIDRSSRFHEQPEIEALAESDPGVLAIDDAALLLGVSTGVLRAACDSWEAMPCVRHLRTGDLVGIPRDGLQVFARAFDVGVTL